jgi:uncharacterized protein (UPF0548 family)
VRIGLRAPSVAALERLAAAERDAALTYDGVGATDGGPTPAGFRPDAYGVDLGPDVDGRFDRCVDAVMRWQVQRGAGFVVAPDSRVTAGATYALAVRLPVGYVSATARVVYVLDDADRGGFAYGTLPAHPEAGEEAFIVVRRDGQVRFEVTAFSRPRDPLARLGAPVTRLLQVQTNQRYLRVMEGVAGRTDLGS